MKGNYCIWQRMLQVCTDGGALLAGVRDAGGTPGVFHHLLEGIFSLDLVVVPGRLESLVLLSCQSSAALGPHNREGSRICWGACGPSSQVPNVTLQRAQAFIQWYLTELNMADAFQLNFN